MKKRFKLAILTLLALCVTAGAACGGTGDNSDSSPSVPTDSSSTVENRTVKLNRETLELDRFAEAMLIAETQEGETLEWFSSDESVVKVDGGRVEAAGIGSAVVTVKIAGTNISDVCTVTVTEATELPLLTLDKESIAVLKGGSLTVVPSVTYRGVKVEDEIAYTWKVDNETIATVSDGVVTGIKVGTAKLSVSAVWKGETLNKTVDITVNADAAVAVTNSAGESVSSVTLRTSLPEGTDSAYIDEIQLTATPYESGEQVDGNIVWSASGSATEVNNGLITVVEVGNTVVRAEYITTEGDTVFAEIDVLVVLPDIDVDNVFEADKTDPEAPLDFTAVTDEEVTAVQYNGTNILDGNKINQDWLNLQQNGDFDIQILTSEVIYNAKLAVFSRYISPDIGDTSQVNIVEIDGNKPLGGLWSAAGEQDSDIIGDTAGVYKYHLTDGKGIGQGFSWRVEINDLKGKYAQNSDYIVLDVFVPEGEQGAAAWGKTTGDIWFDWYVGKELAAEKGFYINSDGIKTNVLQANEWTKVIIPSGTLGLTRIAFLSSGGNDVTYYIKNVRMYSAARWNTPYLTVALPEIVLGQGESYELSSEDFTSLYLGENKITSVSEIVLSGGDESVVSLGGSVITGKGGGTAKVDVTVHVGRINIKTSVNVVVAQSIGPIEFDRSKTGILEISEIKGTIEKVEFEGVLVSESEDISVWLKTLEGCSLDAVEKMLTVTTDQGVYAVTLQVTDTKDYINLSKVNIVNSGGATNLWSAVDSHEGKNEVYHYNSAKTDGTASGITIWNTRVEFNNDALYSKYAYMTAEIYVSAGKSFGFFFGENAGGIFVLQEGTMIGESDAYPYAFDTEGKRMEAFKEGQWITVAVPTSIMIKGRCAFGQTDGQIYDYYVGEMKLYTQENFEESFDVPKLEKKVFIDKSDTSIFKVVDSNNINPWTAEASFEGKENIYHYSSDKGDGTAAGITRWDTRVDFNNNNLYSHYTYLTIEIFVTQGSVFTIYLENDSLYSLTDGTALGTKAFPYAFDAEGNKLETFRTGEWITVVVPVSLMTVKRCGFAEADNELVDFYVSKMCLYTQEAFETEFKL